MYELSLCLEVLCVGEWSTSLSTKLVHLAAWLIYAAILSLPPRLPATAYPKKYMSLKKKEQEGQHDYPLSNHLRCDTMWSPSPSPSPFRPHWNPSYAYDAWYLPLHKLQEEQLQASGTKINSGFICGTIIRNYWLIIHKKKCFFCLRYLELFHRKYEPFSS